MVVRGRRLVSWVPDQRRPEPQLNRSPSEVAGAAIETERLKQLEEACEAAIGGQHVDVLLANRDKLKRSRQDSARPGTGDSMNFANLDAIGCGSYGGRQDGGQCLFGPFEAIWPGLKSLIPRGKISKI